MGYLDLEDHYEFLDFHEHVVFSVPVFVGVEDLSYEPCCYSDVVVHFRSNRECR